MRRNVDKNQWPDEELLQAIREGDKSALNLLLTRYHSKARKQAKWLTRDDGLADELLQEAFCSVIKRFLSTSPVENFAVYLASVITHTWMKSRKKQREEATADALLLEYIENSELQQSAQMKSLSEELEAAELGKQLWNAVGNLPKIQRKVLKLKYIKDLTYPEIACLLKMKENSVKSLVHRSVATLRKRKWE
ncbi:MAG: RNA polymerase sigma factor [Pseudomonadales bacterium]|nr:RNA polymerase sigma factor [Pseudomonadales bacterium]